MSKNLIFSQCNLITVIFLTVFSASGFAANKPSTTEVKTSSSQEKIIPGRYQLVQGKYDSTEVIFGSKPKHEYREGLFLLDTATGDILLCGERYSYNPDPNSKVVPPYLYRRHCEPFYDEIKTSKQ